MKRRSLFGGVAALFVKPQPRWKSMRPIEEYAFVETIKLTPKPPYIAEIIARSCVFPDSDLMTVRLKKIITG